MISMGVVYIAIGPKAREEATRSIEYLRKHWDRDVYILSDNPAQIAGIAPRYVSTPDIGAIAASRYCKVNLDILSPYTYTCYLDADTMPYESIYPPFSMLRDGWDIVLTPSSNQGEGAMHHIDDVERQHTLRTICGSLIQLQAGVMWFAKNERTQSLFEAWRDEWLLWRWQDQAALLRALWNNPAKIHLLGRPWNGGAAIAHRFGRARA